MKQLLEGIWKQNPVFYLAIGLCPALAVTNSFMNALAMSMAVLFVLVCSNIFVLGIRRYIPQQVRIIIFLVIVTTFATISDIYMKANFPDISKALGPYVPLVAVNCIILSRMEGFNLNNPVLKSIMNTLGIGTGFMLALLLLGGIREIIGSGSLMGYNILKNNYQPWKIMLLPSGAFLTLGILIGFYNILDRKK